MNDSRPDHYPLHPAFDPDFATWLKSVEVLPSARFTTRQATAGSKDARQLRYLQGVCEPITIQTELHNENMIAEQLVLLAFIGETDVGFCVSKTGADESDPLFIQLVGVVEAARGRGIGSALMHAAAEQAPGRTIAFATQDDNLAARSMTARFASSIGAELRRVNLGTYRDEDLGIRRGLDYRSWKIARAHPTAACAAIKS
jgi:GNAT superfamily N-acetyltransferase